MIRYAKANATIDDLKKKILDSVVIENDMIDDLEDDIAYAASLLLNGYSSQKIKDDLNAIEVDGENAELIGEFNMPGTEDLAKFEMLNGIPIAWCAMGGDWEMPVVVALYVSDDDELRAYIPENGNAYDHEEKCAYGSERDHEFMNRFDMEKNYVFDSKKLREDVESRIQVK